MAQKDVVTAMELIKSAPGVVFQPTDEQLVLRYLRKKVYGRINVKTCLIREIELYEFKPSELSGLAHDSGHKMMYFFTPLHKKFKKGPNYDRQVPGGVWKKTGNITNINDENGISIATKTSLTFYENDPTERRTEWLMKEYKLIDSQPSNQNDEESEMLTAWTICVVYRRTRRGSNDN